MMFKKNLLLIVFSISFLFSEYTLAQQATLYGTVKSKQEIAIDGLSVEYKKIGTISDSCMAKGTNCSKMEMGHNYYDLSNIQEHY